MPITQLALQPGVIDLSWGHPDLGLMPAEAIREATGAALDKYGAEALSYGWAAGPEPLIDWLCEHLGSVDLRAPQPGELLVTGGVSQALDQVCTLLTSPGDVVLVESPTYHLAVRILRDHPLELIGVPADEHGLIVESLAETLWRFRISRRRARLLYLVPTFNNPTGATLATERRRALVDLAVHEGLTIVEDDVYRELAYDGPPPPSLWSLAPPGTVVRLGSFSKTLAPGLRLGWLTADEPTVRRFWEGGLLDSGGGINHFSALVAAEVGRTGAYGSHVARLRDAYRERRDALVAALGRHLPEGCRWTVPGGGFFLWVTLPESLPAAAAVLLRVEAAGTSFVPGTVFCVDGGGARSLRLAFSLYGPDDLTEAARRLGNALSAPSVTSVLLP
jgi:DNA-binding transcriptional MocR family regulator